MTIDAPSVIKLKLPFAGSLVDTNVHNAKKACIPKKVMIKPKNLKSFRVSCGAKKDIKVAKIK